MALKAPAIVRGREGLLGTIEHPEFVKAGTGEAVDVRLEDGRTLRVPANLLLPQDDGSYALTLSAVEIAHLAGSAGARTDESIVVPVVAEEVEVGKRTVETGRVRLKKTVKATQKVVDEPLIHEDVHVERVAINRPIAEAVGPRQEGDTLIVPLLEEILVVEKRLILREEVRITRRRTEQRSSQTVTLRSEEATVERVEGEPPVDSRA